MKNRKPMKRRGGGDDMDLPAGKTCANCVHCQRCCGIFGHIPEDEVCDWSPSRFRLFEPNPHKDDRRYHHDSGMGGVFEVSIVELLGGSTVRVRVHYPTKDWDGYKFTTTVDRLDLLPKKEKTA